MPLLNENLDVNTNTTPENESGIHGWMASNLIGVFDATIGPEETGTLTDRKNEGSDESKRPGLGSRQVSAGLSDLLGCTKSRKEKNPASKNTELEMNDQADSPPYRRVYVSPDPLERDSMSRRTSAPSSFLSRDTLTLARLYHCSRRSRHHSPKRSVNTDIIPSESLYLPSLACSSLWDIQQDRERSAANQKKDKESDWSFRIASPILDSCSSSSGSMGSMELEELMNGEDDIGGELFWEKDDVERHPKRQKTKPEK